MTCKRTFDVIVLGAGAAGCAAGRAIALQNPGANVCIVEQGSSRAPPIVMRVPLFYPFISSVRSTREFLRSYRGVSESCIGGRKLLYVKGCCLGGSSWCNDMRYLRGSNDDYASWKDNDWTMDSVLPIFKALERNLRDGSDVYHGDSGPLLVTDPPPASVSSELNVRWFESCESLGIPQTDEFNNGSPDGFSVFQSHVGKGVRVDVFDCLLEAERHLLPNVTVMSRTRAHRIVFDGKRATGVEVVEGDQSTVLSAPRLVVCLGSIESPALLLRSGVGPQGTVADLQGVGQNLIQSCCATVVFRVTDGSNLRSKSLSWGNSGYLLSQWREYNEDRSGIFASLCEAGAFVRSTPELAHPDLSLTFYPTPNVRWCGWRPFTGFAVRVAHHYPEARGELTLSNDGANCVSTTNGENIRITSRMLSTRHDVQCMDEGLRWVGSLCGPGGDRYNDRSPFASLDVRLHHPADGLATQRSCAAFLARYAESTGDLFGTCALGSVVDSSLRVRGVEGIYVADASVVPAPTCGSSSVIGAAIGFRVASFLQDPVG
ncbi:oxidoreductase, putative [Trypanosoma equiperdum]|uniref:Oxidoreductase, putative n=2 Tax=Trypanozoon TaxID=39700 RepID=Q383X3_TRYB2|nr:oxidoreductase, putative [Trypanosoma brucei brucei TREU927]EAN79908.1 oxidoreductase, putative [Trypanosoma brucei brucei TREU927]SCU69323.1 oxidoreductase, putative [Trypanosoma equiperdum]